MSGKCLIAVLVFVKRTLVKIKDPGQNEQFSAVLTPFRGLTKTCQLAQSNMAAIQTTISHFTFHMSTKFLFRDI